MSTGSKFATDHRCKGAPGDAAADDVGNELDNKKEDDCSRDGLKDKIEDELEDALEDELEDELEDNESGVSSMVATIRYKLLGMPSFHTSELNSASKSKPPSSLTVSTRSAILDALHNPTIHARLTRSPFFRRPRMRVAGKGLPTSCHRDIALINELLSLPSSNERGSMP
jgi:hypothetical protein